MLQEFSKCVLQMSSTQSPGNSLETQILGPHFIPNESETPMLSLSNLHGNKLFKWFWSTLKLENKGIK